MATGPLIAASTFIGLGMGGFIDGIVLHQVLQWHEMISNILPPVTLQAKSVNMFWDGIFHIFTWIFTAIGIILLWRLMNRTDVPKSTTIFTGGLIFGWGLFNLMDSANHFIFKLHNLKENVPDPLKWNSGFLVFGAILLIIIGWIIIEKGRRQIQKVNVA